MRNKVTHGMYDHSVNRLWVEMFISLYGKNFARKFEDMDGRNPFN